MPGGEHIVLEQMLLFDVHECIYLGRTASLGFANEKDKKEPMWNRLPLGSPLGAETAQTRAMKPLQPSSEVWREMEVFHRPYSGLVHLECLT